MLALFDSIVDTKIRVVLIHLRLIRELFSWGCLLEIIFLFSLAF
jgi:hypothetical protein